jgi:hypothetical protein
MIEAHVDELLAHLEHRALDGADGRYVLRVSSARSTGRAARPAIVGH